MKKFLQVLSSIIILFILIGLVDQLLELNWPKVFLPSGVLAIAFVWMPVFLFYAYDRRQRKKEEVDED